MPYKSKAEAKAWEDRNKEWRNKKQREYYEKYKAKRKLSHKRWYEENKEKHNLRSRRNRIKTNFGITMEEYDTLLLSQNYKCMICSKDISNGKQHLDHCHKTGRLRAFLCGTCNTGIGMLQDSANLCKKASEYLERYIDKE